MDKTALYEILKESVRELHRESDLFIPLPVDLQEDALLESIGLDPLLLPDILGNMKKRFGGRDLGSCLENPSTLLSLDDLLSRLSKALGHGIASPSMVYVDDEDANLFIFSRRFDRHFRIRYFSDPAAALDFILADPSVALVVTDEVMPGMTGNQLCDRAHAFKPSLKFILMTGNPNNQDDLLYATMRKNRFFEFFQKPVDFEKRFEELRELFASVLGPEGARP